jgi:hypothetical protein
LLLLRPQLLPVFWRLLLPLLLPLLLLSLLLPLPQPEMVLPQLLLVVMALLVPLLRLLLFPALLVLLRRMDRIPGSDGVGGPVVRISCMFPYPNEGCG